MLRLNLIPKKKNYFERTESTGSLIVSATGIDDSILVNATTLKVLELVDGIININEIIEKLHFEYHDVDIQTIKKDVNETLKALYKTDVINFESEDIMESKNIISDFYSYKVEKLSEVDFKRIINYIGNTESKLQYLNGYNNSEYTEIMIRNRLFKYIEEYFCLINSSNEIVGIVSYNKNITQYGSFYTNGLVIYNENLNIKVISEFIKASSLYIYNGSQYNCKKIRILYYYQGNNLLKEALENAGYKSIINNNTYLIGDVKEEILDFGLMD